MEPKRAPKLFHYKTKSTWCSARRGMLSAAGRPNIVIGSPPEFKGEPDIWAPEELLVGSLNTCMMLTFLTLAQAQGLIPVGYESEAEDLLENVEEKYHITEVTVRPRVTLKSEAELEPARKIMDSFDWSASSEKHPQTIVFLRRPKGPCQCCYFPFAFSPTSLFEPANLMPKSIARLRTPAGVRFSRTAIAAEFSPDAARARS